MYCKGEESVPDLMRCNLSVGSDACYLDFVKDWGLKLCKKWNIFKRQYILVKKNLFSSLEDVRLIIGHTQVCQFNKNFANESPKILDFFLIFPTTLNMYFK